MSKRNIWVLLALVSLLLLSSCGRNGGMVVGEDEKANARMEQIVSAIKDKDKEALKSLFSKKALDEAKDFDGGVDSLFNLIQGNIESWKYNGFASDESMDGGKRSWMIRFAFDVKTDKDVYSFFVIDYNVDTKNPDNQGVYMLELIKNKGKVALGSWQDRMRAGIYIH